jgi:hypothetical protein
MKEKLALAAIACIAVGFGIFAGNLLGGMAEQKRLGTAVCKTINGKFATLDSKPVCIMPSGIMRFYED